MIPQIKLRLRKIPILVKALSKINTITNQALDILWQALHKGADIKDTIVISGTPRSGSTWVMEILDTLPDYRSILEPFNTAWYPQIRKLSPFLA